MTRYNETTAMLHWLRHFFVHLPLLLHGVKRQAISIKWWLYNTILMDRSMQEGVETTSLLDFFFGGNQTLNQCLITSIAFNQSLQQCWCENAMRFFLLIMPLNGQLNFLIKVKKKIGITPKVIKHNQLQSRLWFEVWLKWNAAWKREIFVSFSKNDHASCH